MKIVTHARATGAENTFLGKDEIINSGVGRGLSWDGEPCSQTILLFAGECFNSHTIFRRFVSSAEIPVFRCVSTSRSHKMTNSHTHKHISQNEIH